MDKIEPGMVALALDDRRLGTVRSTRHCCFEVLTEENRERWFLTRTAVFNVDMRVTLICLGTEVGRYACPIHDPGVQAKRGGFA